MTGPGTALLGQTVEAVLVSWSALAALADAGSDAAPDGEPDARLRRAITAACAAGVDVAVFAPAPVGEVDRFLRARPGGPGRLWLCAPQGRQLHEVGRSGPRLRRSHPYPADGPASGTAHGPAVDPAVGPSGDPADSPASGPANGPAVAAREVFTLLAEDGVTGGLVLVVGSSFAAPGCDGELLVPEARRAQIVSVGDAGTAHAGVRDLGGGLDTVIGLLTEQVERRRRRRVPAVDWDPEWIVVENGRDPLRHRITETLFTIGAGGVATRGAVEEDAPGSQPLVLAAGIYTRNGPDQHLLPGPSWTHLAIDPPPDDDVRVLDLRTGVLYRREVTADGVPLRSMRFASLSVPGLMVLRAEAAAERLRPGPVLRDPERVECSFGRLGDRHWARASADGPAGIGVMATQHSGRRDGLRTVERMAAYVADGRRQPGLGEAAGLLDIAASRGVDRLLREHRAAWARRWNDVDIWLPGDVGAEQAIRYALFQLWCNVNRHDEIAVGARGLSGPGYSGHVFWDADVFVLPAMASIDPRAAAAMIRYRLKRLAAAQAAAAASGHRGARFPWESAATGDDVTPTLWFGDGRAVPILTGQREEHITADVAWAAMRYAQWCGVEHTPRRLWLPLLVETARYWATRLTADDDGSLHLRGVIGPDEYHEDIDDNAFTNVMARWNLRTAATVAERTGVNADEAPHWRDLAERIVDGLEPATGRYVQFAGYDDLEPLLIRDVATPPVAADLLLGRERVVNSQLIKQPDVLMLHHLVPDEVAPGSLLPNLDFYLPRTAHGSSLSPAVSAALLARAGRPDEALDLVQLALELDPGDHEGMSAAGLHLANLGGLWQAVIAGFLGVSVRRGVLTIDPCLPGPWSDAEVRFRCLGRRLRVVVAAGDVTVHADGPLTLRIGDGPAEPMSGTARGRVRARGNPR